MGVLVQNFAFDKKINRQFSAHPKFRRGHPMPLCHETTD